VPWSRQLDAVKDAKVIADYGRPEFVLAGVEARSPGHTTRPPTGYFFGYPTDCASTMTCVS